MSQFFVCIICGRIYGLEEIKYSNPEKYKEKVKDAILHLVTNTSYYEREQWQASLNALNKLNPEEEIYIFTFCHGYFKEAELNPSRRYPAVV